MYTTAAASAASAAAATAAATATAASPPAIAEVLRPPEHFAIVEQSLYRSTMPSSANFPFLKTLGLRHVIILSQDSLTASVTAFFNENSITVSHTGAEAGRSGRSGRSQAWKTHAWKPIEDEVVKSSLELLLRADVQPLLICDTSGVRRVGVVVGCLRRLQWWNLNSIVNEYRSFAGRKTRYVHEQMIELFDTDLVVIPEKNPPWYTAQCQMQDEDITAFQDFAKRGLLNESGAMRYDRKKGEGGGVVDIRYERSVSEDATIKASTARVVKSADDGAGGDQTDAATDAIAVPPVSSDVGASAYRMYYYSTQSPLNTVQGALPPRIQRLK